MLRIKQKQTSAFFDRARADFLDRACARLRDDFPETLGTWSPESLRLRADGSCARFEAIGFTRTEHLYRLIVLDLLCGHGFEHQLPDAQRAHLADRRVPEAERFWALYRAAEQLPILA